MTYTGPPAPHAVTESDWLHTGCGEFGTSDCAPSVWVQQVGDSYLIGFQGELRGGAAPALQAFDTGSGVATITARRDGLQYATLELLDLTTGSGNDVVNVRGTGAVSHTDLHTGAGDDRIYVSSLAAVPLTGRPDYLFGDLSLIGGTLNIDAGTGRQTLMISDEAGQAARTALITRTRTPPPPSRDGPRTRTPDSGRRTSSRRTRCTSWAWPTARSPTGPTATSPTASGSGPGTAPTPSPSTTPGAPPASAPSPG